MKLGQFKRRVSKEFAKSPAKTIVLIALCPVALYFLAPLFLPAKSKIDESQKAKVIAQNFVPSARTSTSHSSPSTDEPGPSWHQLNSWIAADWRRTSPTFDEDERDPFQAAFVEPTGSEVVVEAPPKALDAPSVMSQDAFHAMPLKLTGTLLGRNSRSATISGRRYLEGTIVTPMPKGRLASVPQQTFVLKHVGARHAILELDGVRFRLELDASPPLSHGITVVRNPVAAPN